MAPYRHDLTVVCECTFNWFWLADACEEAGITFVLAHALYTVHIHGGKNKNDRIDAEKLAHLLRTNLIPPAYVYPREKRPVRSLLRQRMRYVWSRSEILTHLSMNQTAQGKVPVLKGGRNRDAWQERILAQTEHPFHQVAVRCDMEAVKLYDQLVERLDGTLLLHAREYHQKELDLLLSVPGIGEVLALTILYEIDTIERFPTVKDFTSYCRLVKGSVASAGKLKGLTGGKMGNAYLRWAFGEAAVICKRAHRLITPYAEKLVAKHGTFKGNAILANQIARSVYFMLQSGQIFDAERMIAHSI